LCCRKNKAKGKGQKAKVKNEAKSEGEEQGKSQSECHSITAKGCQVRFGFSLLTFDLFLPNAQSWAINTREGFKI